jgi:hypothetical protein
MTEKTVQPAVATVQSEQSQAVVDAKQKQEDKRVGDEDSVELLRNIQENVGQMSELAKEEDSLVKEFFNLLLRIMKPFSKTLDISTSSLPENYHGRADKAYLHFSGQLVLVYKNGEVEILNLAEQENHSILIGITGEIMTKLKVMIDSCRSKTETRVKFLMSITKELQKVAKVFSEDYDQKPDF